MKDWNLLRTGTIGSVVAAIFCFTPAVALLLGAAGLSAWLGWADYVLLPVLVLFVGLTVYALVMRWRGARRSPAPSSSAPATHGVKESGSP